MSNLDEETPSLLRSPHRQRGSTPTPSQAPLSSDPGRSRFRSPNCRRGSSPAPSQDHEPSDPVKSSPRSSRRKYSHRSSSRSRRQSSLQSNSSMSPEGRSTSRPYHRDLSRHSSSRTPGLSSLRSLRDSSVSSDRRSRSQSSRRSNRSWSHHSPDHLSPYSRSHWKDQRPSRSSVRSHHRSPNKHSRRSLSSSTGRRLSPSHSPSRSRHLSSTRSPRSLQRSQPRTRHDHRELMSLSENAFPESVRQVKEVPASSKPPLNRFVQGLEKQKFDRLPKWTPSEPLELARQGIEVPKISISPPMWDLNVVLKLLAGAPFEPLRLASLQDLTAKTLFLVTLATAKRLGEIQAISASGDG
ncbi:uncharacterized protein [Palaemon carinicauda]|uniref:uncharacterized protein n=1 Tax=Palaemon carinicauda TaxID=392227 RepID=UPI0035B61E98